MRNDKAGGMGDMGGDFTPPEKSQSTKGGNNHPSPTNQGRRIATRDHDRASFGDPSDFLKDKYNIQILHVPTRQKVKFKAWVTSFSDSYSSNWNTEDTYGRMDPITTFNSTSRVITIEWDVVAAHKSEAKGNMKNCELLFKMLYPTYLGMDDNAASISAAPVFKVKFGNLISSDRGAATSGVEEAGLLGTMGGFEYSPDFDAGFFLGNGAMYPQTISLSAEFQVIHNFKVGWDANTSTFRSDGYPYGDSSVNPSSMSAAQANAFADNVLSAFGNNKATEKITGGGNN